MCAFREAMEEREEGHEGVLQITRCDSCPLCVCHLTKNQTEAVIPRPARTRTPTQCNSQRLFLSPPVSQSICPNTISRSPDFLLRERENAPGM